jgi:hypothetical protein
VATEAVRGIGAMAQDLAANQKQTLNGMQEQQTSVATELAQVAHDISTISMRTAQRQDEVAQDLGKLIAQLDRVLQGLGRTAGIDVEAPAPGRLDPERLWPRRRS